MTVFKFEASFTRLEIFIGKIVTFLFLLVNIDINSLHAKIKCNFKLIDSIMLLTVVESTRTFLKALKLIICSTVNFLIVEGRK